MNKEKIPQATGTKPEPEQAAFEKLPEETKELMKLKNRKEKTIGSERVVVTRKIEDTEGKSQP